MPTLYSATVFPKIKHDRPERAVVPVFPPAVNLAAGPAGVSEAGVSD
jgi:hypothetical protein